MGNRIHSIYRTFTFINPGSLLGLLGTFLGELVRLQSILLHNGKTIAVERGSKYIKIYYGKGKEQEFRTLEEFRKWLQIKFNYILP